MEIGNNDATPATKIPENVNINGRPDSVSVSESVDDPLAPVDKPPEKPTAYAWFVLFIIFAVRALH